MRRFFITCITILVLILSALGVESLIMGNQNSILRQTLTSPVREFIESPSNRSDDATPLFKADD